MRFFFPICNCICTNNLNGLPISFMARAHSIQFSGGSLIPGYGFGWGGGAMKSWNCKYCPRVIYAIIQFIFLALLACTVGGMESPPPLPPLLLSRDPSTYPGSMPTTPRIQPLAADSSSESILLLKLPLGMTIEKDENWPASSEEKPCLGGTVWKCSRTTKTIGKL